MKIRRERALTTFKSIGSAFLLVGAMTALIAALHADRWLDSVSILYIIVVIVAAVNFGRTAALATSVLSALAYDFFFVPPYFTFEMDRLSDWVTWCAFIFVAIVTGTLTSRLKVRVQEAQRHDLEMTSLAEVSWDIALQLDPRKSTGMLLSKLIALTDFDRMAVVTGTEDGVVKIYSEVGLNDEDFSKLVAPNRLTIFQFIFDRGLVIGNIDGHVPPALSLNQSYGTSPQPLSIKQSYEAASQEQLPSSMMVGAVHAPPADFVTKPLLDEPSDNSKDSICNLDPEGLYWPVIIDGHVKAVLYCHRSETSLNEHSNTEQLFAAFLNQLASIIQREQFLKVEARSQALQEADKLKTALLSMISHDFKSPITAIKASLSTLSSATGHLSDEVLSTLYKVIEDQSDRLNRMVGNILDLSRLESGSWRPKLEEIPASELIASVLGHFDIADSNRIKVTNEAGEAIVLADWVQIAQVLHNLLENALKYSAEDLEVELRTHLSAQTIIFEVLDKGMGIDDDALERIFLPFFRAPRPGQSALPGNGIGLAVCKGLVEANGGVIEAHNRVQKGALFCVTLPAKEVLVSPNPISYESISNR